MRTLRLVFLYFLFLIAVAPLARAQMVGGTISGEVDRCLRRSRGAG